MRCCGLRSDRRADGQPGHSPRRRRPHACWRAGAAGHEVQPAVLLVGHLNKGVGTAGTARVIGSIAFVAAARMVYFLAADSRQRSRLLLVPVKTNLAPMAWAGLKATRWSRSTSGDGNRGAADPLGMTCRRCAAPPSCCAVGRQAGAGGGRSVLQEKCLPRAGAAEDHQDGRRDAARGPAGARSSGLQQKIGVVAPASTATHLGAAGAADQPEAARQQLPRPPVSQ